MARRMVEPSTILWRTIRDFRDILELSSYDGVENLCQTEHDAYETHQGHALRILLENFVCRRGFYVSM